MTFKTKTDPSFHWLMQYFFKLGKHLYVIWIKLMIVKRIDWYCLMQNRTCEYQCGHQSALIDVLTGKWKVKLDSIFICPLGSVDIAQVAQLISDHFIWHCNWFFRICPWDNTCASVMKNSMCYTNAKWHHHYHHHHHHHQYHYYLYREIWHLSWGLL